MRNYVTRSKFTTKRLFRETFAPSCCLHEDHVLFSFAALEIEHDKKNCNSHFKGGPGGEICLPDITMP